MKTIISLVKNGIFILLIPSYYYIWNLWICKEFDVPKMGYSQVFLISFCFVIPYIIYQCLVFALRNWEHRIMFRESQKEKVEVGKKIEQLFNQGKKAEAKEMLTELRRTVKNEVLKKANEEFERQMKNILRL